MTEDEPVAKSSLTRADSVDDMIAQVIPMIMTKEETNYSKRRKLKINCFFLQVKLLSQRRPVVKKDSEEESSSGRSTPVHLR